MIPNQNWAKNTVVTPEEFGFIWWKCIIFFIRIL